MIPKPLPPPFHWRSIRHIDTDEIPQLAELLGITLDPHFYIKSNWSYHRQYDIFGINNKPIFHIKKSIELDLFFETLALHLGQLADPELCPSNYLVGTYDVGFWRWKSPIPYVLTTFVVGTQFKKGEQLNYLSQLGRHFIFHKFLELHDVEERHFLIRDNILVRIDFDLSFRELQGKYTGFDRWIKKYEFFNHSSFLRGASFEVNQIRKNLSNNRAEFLELMDAVKMISEKETGDKLFQEFYRNLVQYWNNNCADILENFNFSLL